jgi:SAM-dependent methyltransferase
MAHKQQKQFCKWVRRRHPKQFKDKLVIDVGSLDINGNNRYLFTRGYYFGIDVVSGDNVDFVGKAHELLPDITDNIMSLSRYRRGTFTIKIEADVIVSTECLEHDSTWENTLLAMYDALRPGGLLLITAAGEGRPEHGTTDYHAWCSPGTNDYYKNISNRMFASVLTPGMFTEYYLAQDKRNFDINFYGIKI